MGRAREDVNGSLRLQPRRKMMIVDVIVKRPHCHFLVILGQTHFVSFVESL